MGEGHIRRRLIEVGRPRPTSADRCLQDTVYFGRPRATSVDRCVQAISDDAWPRPTHNGSSLTRFNYYCDTVISRVKLTSLTMV